MLSYVAQLGPPPRSLLSRELGLLARLLHVPPQSFGLSDLMNIHNYGLPRIRSLSATLHASLLRAAA
eukprot:2553297-Heterocapsa_arctica.AAC.1